MRLNALEEMSLKICHSEFCDGFAEARHCEGKGDKWSLVVLKQRNYAPQLGFFFYKVEAKYILYVVGNIFFILN